jgi:hypothetical protein
MKFYIVTGDDGAVGGCETSLKRARKLVAGLNKGERYTLQCIECPVSSETIRLLLAGWGGYATSTTTVVEGER